MDSTNSNFILRKDKLTTIPDAGNTAERSLRVVIENILPQNIEEMKENVVISTPKSSRRKSLRSGRKTPRKDYRHCFFSSDEEGEKKQMDRKIKCDGSEVKPRRKRKPSGKTTHEEVSSVEEDSALECEEPETKRATEVGVDESEILPNHASPPKRKEDESDSEPCSTPRFRARKSSRRIHSSDDDTTDIQDDVRPQETSDRKLRKPKHDKRLETGDGADSEKDVPRSVGHRLSSTKRAFEVAVDESEILPNHASPPKTPKRKKDESDSEPCSTQRFRARKSSRRIYSSDDDTTDIQDDVRPQETSDRKLRKPKHDKRLETGDGADSEKDVPRSVGDDASSAPASGKMTKSTETGRQLRSKTPKLKSHKAKEASRRNEDSDFLPKGRLERMPKHNETPKSKCTRTPSARNLKGGAEQLPEAAGDVTPNKTPKRRGKTPKKSPAKTPRNLRPSMPERTNSIADTGSALDLVRANLHVSAVPTSLPCREKEFKDIYCFVGGKISDSVGGCMYISGMPGTGKTATVHAVVRHLKRDVAEGLLPEFQYIEVNGLKLTEPRQVFVRILQELTGEKCTPQHAQEILAKKFTSAKGCNKAVLLLVDEVDMLRNRRQDVVYSLFDWPSKAHSKLVVLTIANTMDLPERLLMGRVTSRLGLTRLTFQPYNHKQLQEIVTARLQGSECFNPDAVQLVARKVAAVSGDARRALDICRRSTELLSSDNDCVSMDVINATVMQMMNSASIKTLKSCSRMEQLFLQAVVAEMKRTGVEETNFNSVYRQFKEICYADRIRVPNVSQSLGIVNRLGSSRILLTEHGKADIMQTIHLNVNRDDIHYAMTNPVAA